MKKVLLILLLNTSAWAACPLFTYPENHKLDAEINNVCDNILNPTINYETVTKAIFNNISVSTITSVTSMTVTNLTVTSGLAGVTDGSDATAGKLGEYLSSTAGTTSLVTALSGQDLTSISLTPGDWNVTGMVKFTQNTATWSSALLYIANEAGNSFANASEFNSFQNAWANSAATPTQISMTNATVRISVSVNTSIYLKVRANWSAGTPQAEGSITARRIR